MIIKKGSFTVKNNDWLLASIDACEFDFGAAKLLVMKKPSTNFDQAHKCFLDFDITKLDTLFVDRENPNPTVEWTKEFAEVSA